MPYRFLLLLVVLLASTGAWGSDPTLPHQRPLTDRVFESTPERLGRGQYLVEHLLQCFICHSERDWTQPGAPPAESRKGAGAVYSQKGERIVVAPNITPDVETGAGGWTDDMLARAIREGIGHDGRALYPAMWYESFAALSDEDLAAVVAYLRSIPAVRNVLPRTHLLPDEIEGIAAIPKPITEPVAGPTPGDPLARGKYLVNVSDCSGCHTSWYSSRNPGLFAGGNPIVRGERTAFSGNITPHESGVGYTTDAFIAVMRGGKGGSMSPIMPWTAFRGLSDADLGAMHLALGTVPPVAHYIGNVGEQSHCAVCGQEHPLGSYNRLDTPLRVAVDPGRLARLAGRYYSPKFQRAVTIRHDDERLYGQEEGGPQIELIAQSDVRFLAPGWPSPIEFVLDADGRVARFDVLELDRIPFERQP